MKARIFSISSRLSDVIRWGVTFSFSLKPLGCTLGNISWEIWAIIGLALVAAVLLEGGLRIRNGRQSGDNAGKPDVFFEVRESVFRLSNYNHNRPEQPLDMAEVTLIVSGGKAKHPPVTRAFEADSLVRGKAVEAEPDDEGVRSMVGCGRSLPDQKIVIADPDTIEIIAGCAVR